MKRFLVTGIFLSLVGCGGTYTAPLTIGTPNNASANIGTQSLTATMTSAGTGTPDTWTIPRTGKLIIPLPAAFMVLQNSSQAWQVNLVVNSGAQTCNYTHAAGATTITAGTGCSVATTSIPVNLGDTVTLSIASGVTQTASVGVNLTETN
jgi:hypothetical protein